MKNKKWISRWALWVVYVIGIIVAIIFKVEHDGNLLVSLDINTAISIGFFVIVFMIFVKAFKRFGKGDELANKLNVVNLIINDWRQNGSKPNEIMEQIRKGDITFGENTLDIALEEYKNDVEDMLRASENTYLDIDSYINNSLIDKEIHSHFLNQISGAMTGFGILGTFLGLSVGLNSFNLSGNSADLTNQIQPLMEGIKVAFHTSIFGIVYSLGFNYVYRQLLAKYHGEIHEFQASFHKCAVPITDNGTESTLIKYMKRMEVLLQKQVDEVEKSNSAYTVHNKMMNGNLENIHGTLCQTQRIVGSMSDEISGSLTKIMIDIVVPEIQKMGMMVEDFAESAKKDQIEELSRLVDAFIQDMNRSLGNSFEELGNVIRDTNEWQKKSLDEMQKVLDTVNDTTLDLVNIDSLVEKAIESVSKYTSEVERMQEDVNRNLESLNVQCDMNNEIVQKQIQRMTDINEKQAVMQDGMIDAMDKIKTSSEQTTQYVENAMEHLKNSSNVMTESITSNTENMRKSIEHGTEESMIKIEQLSTDMFGKTTKYFGDAMEQVKNSTNVITESMVSNTENMRKSIERGTEESLTKMEQISADMFEKTAKYIGDAMEHVQNSSKTITESVTSNTENMRKSIEQGTEDSVTKIEQITADMIEKTTKHVGEAMEQVRNSTNTMSESVATNTENMRKSIEQGTEQSMAKMEQIATDMLGTTTKHVEDAMVQVQNSTISMTESIASNNEYMCKCVGQSTEEMLKDIKHKTVESISSMSNLCLEVLNKLNQQIENVNALDNQVMSDIAGAADRLGIAAEKFDDRMQERIKDTFITFDQQLANITSHLAGVLQQMEKVSKNTKNTYDEISAGVEDEFRMLQEKLEQYLEYADKLHHDITTKWEFYRQTSMEVK